MGTSQEVKDFLGGFTSGFKMMDDSFYKQALSDYYRKGGKKGNKGILGYAVDDDDKPGGLLGWLAGNKEDDRDPVEIGAEKLLRAEKEATIAGRPDDVAKIREMQKLHVKQHSPAAAPKTAAPKTAAPPKPAAPPPSSAPNPPTVAPNNAQPISKINATDEDLLENDDELLEDASFETPDTEFEMPDTAIPDFGLDVATGGYIEDPNEEAIPTEAADEQYSGSSDIEATAEDDDAAFDFALQMEKAAAPGLEAGLKFLQQRVTAPQAGVPDGTGTPEDNINILATNEGAASEEEVRAIDSVIDPEGKLPPEAKSAARTRAIWEFYEKQGDPDKAADLIQRLMLYDRKNAQTRGALAVQAFGEGRYDEGVRLIKDANNNDTSSATLIQKAVYNPDDQTVTAVVRDENGKQEVKLPIQQVAAEATNVANGRASFDRLVASVGKRGGTGSGQPSGAEAIASEVFRAKAGLQRALRTNDPKAIAAARGAYEAAEDKAIDFAAKYGAKADRVLRGLGINANQPPKDPKPAGQPRQPVPTEKERAQAAKNKEVADLQGKYQDRLYNAYSLAQAGIKVDEEGNATEAVPTGPGGRRSEVAAEAQARETQRPTMERMGNQYNVERSGLAYRQAPDLKQYAEKPFEERTTQLAEETAGLVASRAEKGKPPIMDAKQQRQFIREADRLAMKNNVDAGAVVEFLWNAKNNLNEGIKYDAKTGMVQLGSTKLFVDEDMLRDIAAARGSLAKKATGAVEGMDAKAIDKYKQNSRSARDRDERDQALKSAVRQGVPVDMDPEARGADTSARSPFKRGALVTRKRIENERRRDSYNEDRQRLGIPEMGSTADPTGRDEPAWLSGKGVKSTTSDAVKREREEEFKRQRRRWGYPTVGK